MVGAALTIIPLAVAASLASWLFSQWIGCARVYGAALAVGGGTVLLIGAAAFAIIAASAWWKLQANFACMFALGDLSKSEAASNLFPNI